MLTAGPTGQMEEGERTLDVSFGIIEARNSVSAVQTPCQAHAARTSAPEDALVPAMACKQSYEGGAAEQTHGRAPRCRRRAREDVTVVAAREGSEPQ